MTQHLFADIRKTFKNYFEGLDREFVKRLIFSMEYFSITKDYRQDLTRVVILKAGKVPKSIFFLVSGTLLICCVSGVRPFMQLHPGGIYGEAYVLFGIPNTYALAYDTNPNMGANPTGTVNAVEGYKVRAEDYLSILKDYHGVYLLLRAEAIRKRRIYRSLKQASLQAIGVDAG